jgi:hypothetical protein
MTRPVYTAGPPLADPLQVTKPHIDSRGDEDEHGKNDRTALPVAGNNGHENEILSAMRHCVGPKSDKLLGRD